MHQANFFVKNQFLYTKNASKNELKKAFLKELQLFRNPYDIRGQIAHLIPFSIKYWLGYENMIILHAQIEKKQQKPND